MAQTRARGARRARVGPAGGARGAGVLGVIAANNAAAPASAVAAGLVRAAVEGGLDGGGLTAEQQQQLFLAQLERERDTIRIANLEASARLEAIERQAAAAERREEEVHQARLQAVRAGGGNIGLGTGAGLANNMYQGREDEEGERDIPAPVLKVIDSFARHPRSALLSIARKRFPAENLTRLRWNTNVGDEKVMESWMEDGRMMQKRVIGKMSAFGKTPEVWAEGFLTWTSILVSMFPQQGARLYTALINFHLEVMVLSRTYAWQGATLNLAIHFHNLRNTSGLLDPDQWVLSSHLIDQFTRGKVKPLDPIPAPGRPSAPGAPLPSSASTKSHSCHNFNNGTCTFSPCKFKHECSVAGCGSKEHGALKHEDAKP